MKRYLLFFILITLVFPVLAEDEVYLDLGSVDRRYFETGKLNFGNPEADFSYDEEKYIKPSDAFDSIKSMYREDFSKSEEQ